MRRKCKYIVDPYVHGKPYDWADGFCLLITGGMMSSERAVVEQLDGTMRSCNIEHVQFVDALVGKEGSPVV